MLLVLMSLCASSDIGHHCSDQVCFLDVVIVPPWQRPYGIPSSMLLLFPRSLVLIQYCHQSLDLPCTSLVTHQLSFVLPSPSITVIIVSVVTDLCSRLDNV